MCVCVCVYICIYVYTLNYVTESPHLLIYKNNILKIIRLNLLIFSSKPGLDSHLQE